MPSKLSDQKEKFPAWSFHWICCSTYCLFINMFFHVNESLVSHFLLIGFDVWQYFTLKNLPHKVFLVLKIHHCLNWKAIQIYFKFLIHTPPSSLWKTRFFHDAQWYLFLPFLHPKKKFSISIWICLSTVVGGVTTKSICMGIACNTCFFRTDLPP